MKQFILSLVFVSVAWGTEPPDPLCSASLPKFVAPQYAPFLEALNRGNEVRALIHLSGLEALGKLGQWQELELYVGLSRLPGRDRQVDQGIRERLGVQVQWDLDKGRLELEPFLETWAYAALWPNEFFIQKAQGMEIWSRVAPEEWAEGAGSDADRAVAILKSRSNSRIEIDPHSVQVNRDYAVSGSLFFRALLHARPSGP